MLRRLWAALVRACAAVLSRWADRAVLSDNATLREDLRERDHHIGLLQSRNGIQADEIESLALRCEREAERFRADIAALKAKQFLDGDGKREE